MNNDPTTYQITINLTGDDINALQDILQTVSEMEVPERQAAQRIARALDDAGDTAIVDNASDTAEPIPSPDFPDWND